MVRDYCFTYLYLVETWYIEVIVSLTLSNKNWTHLIVLGRLLTSILFSNIQSLHSVVSEGAEKQKTNLSIIDTQTNSNIPLLIRIRSVIIQLNSVQKKLINIEYPKTKSSQLTTRCTGVNLHIGNQYALNFPNDFGSKLYYLFQVKGNLFVKY